MASRKKGREKGCCEDMGWPIIKLTDPTINSYNQCATCMMLLGFVFINRAENITADDLGIKIG